MTNRITTLALTLALSATVAGCADDPDCFVLVGDWTPADQATITAQMDAWCTRSNGAHCAHLGEGSDIGDGNSTIVLMSADGPNYGELMPGPSHWDTIRVADERTTPEWPTTLGRTVLHELGHHFRGMGHLPQGVGNVMAPCQSGTVLTDDDLNAPLDDSIVCE